jgi:hypothetical protein
MQVTLRVYKYPHDRQYLSSCSFDRKTQTLIIHSSPTKMVHLTIAAIAAILSFTSAQTPGTREIHPRLTTQQCTKWGGCRTQQTSVVLDALSHKIHTKNGTACTAASNGKECIIDGVDYAEAGVYTSGSSVRVLFSSCANLKSNNFSKR